MRVLLYADFRSPHAQGWLTGLNAAGLTTLAVSSEKADYVGAIDPVDALGILRAKIANYRKSHPVLPGNNGRVELVHSTIAVARLPSRRVDLSKIVQQFLPDVVHALRLPYEGVTAAAAIKDRPVVVSTWGQDFVPQAVDSWILRAWMLRVLPKVAGLHVDALPDVGRAMATGVAADVPVLYAAGNFGVDRQLFHPVHHQGSPLILFPRGVQRFSQPSFVLHCIEQLAAIQANVRFVAVGFAANPEAEALAGRLDGRLELTARLPRDGFAAFMRQADVVVSPSTSDGTPNSILESLACGAQVVAYDLPSLRRLGLESGITLVPALNVMEFCKHIMNALARPRGNVQLPIEFERQRNLRAVPRFYEDAIGRWRADK